MCRFACPRGHAATDAGAEVERRVVRRAHRDDERDLAGVDGGAARELAGGLHLALALRAEAGRGA